MNKNDTFTNLMKQLNDFKSNVINEEKFIENINAVFADLKNRSNEDKIQEYDKILEFVKDMFTKTEFEDNYGERKLYQDEDDVHYLYETVLQTTMSDNIFDFTNEVYSS